jgi:5-methylcytosine-specific restriction endonuclease McrA
VTDFPAYKQVSVADLVPYARKRVCRGCGRSESVRKDNKSTQCKSCASSAAGKITAAKRKAQAHRPPCENCGQPVKTYRAKFCSVSCKSASARESRICKHCSAEFTVLKSSLKTNASGNFCSRPCYERYLCNGDRTTGRGSQWSKIRSEVLAGFPFCAVCGTTKNLQVHHIIPFRLTRDNSKANLVPLCVTHHRWIETMFVDTERFGIDACTQEIWRGMIRSKQAVTATTIKEIARELAV